MEFLLSYEYQSHVTNPFPVRQDALEHVFHDMNSPVTYYDANGQKMDLVRTLEINRSATVVNPLTQADFDKILNCFNSITAAYYSDDETLVSIIYEEAIPYINGLKSVEQVADIIQNRVQTYVDERMD